MINIASFIEQLYVMVLCWSYPVAVIVLISSYNVHLCSTMEPQNPIC